MDSVITTIDRVRYDHFMPGCLETERRRTSGLWRRDGKVSTNAIVIHLEGQTA